MKWRVAVCVAIVAFVAWYNVLRLEDGDDYDGPAVVVVPQRFNIWEIRGDDRDHVVQDEAKRTTYMTVFQNRRKKATCGVLVLCGGGYERLDLEQGYALGRWLVELGYTAFVLEYRLPVGEGADQTVNPLEDIFRATTIVHSSLWKLPVLGVLGVDAGGHLAALMTNGWNHCDPTDKGVVTKRSHCFNFAVLLAPLINLSNDALTNSEMRARFLGGKGRAGEAEEFSADHHVTKLGAPTLILHSADDGVIPMESSRHYLHKLEAMGVEAKLHQISSNVGHDVMSAKQEWEAIVGLWMSKHWN